MQTIAFVSPYCLIDHSSGAAVATNDCLQFLAGRGFRCLAYCGAQFDFRAGVDIEQLLADVRVPYQARVVAADGLRAKLLLVRVGRVALTVFRNQQPLLGPAPSEIRPFLAGYQEFLERQRPDVVMTYGGGPITREIIGVTRSRQIPVVFALKNLSYQDPGIFRSVDYVVVPSQFARDYYLKKHGLMCHVLPDRIAPERVRAAERAPQHLTFVNPEPQKGLFVFARIAEQMSRRRPDIPILIVEGRERSQPLAETRVDLSWARNLFGMTDTPDPRRFYAVTKVTLMPSLVEETFGLVAAESMMNGIPVVASNRGALPETIGSGGILLDIPARYRPETKDVPSAAEVEPWIETILRLWDDPGFYQEWSRRALQRAQHWQADRAGALYAEFFANLRLQPRPPLRD